MHRRGVGPGDRLNGILALTIDWEGVPNTTGAHTLQATYWSCYGVFNLARTVADHGLYDKSLKKPKKEEPVVDCLIMHQRGVEPHPPLQMIAYTTLSGRALARIRASRLNFGVEIQLDKKFQTFDLSNFAKKKRYTKYPASIGRESNPVHPCARKMPTLYQAVEKCLFNAAGAPVNGADLVSIVEGLPWSFKSRKKKANRQSMHGWGIEPRSASELCVNSSKLLGGQGAEASLVAKKNVGSRMHQWGVEPRPPARNTISSVTIRLRKSCWARDTLRVLGMFPGRQELGSTDFELEVVEFRAAIGAFQKLLGDKRLPPSKKRGRGSLTCHAPAGNRTLSRTRHRSGGLLAMVSSIWARNWAGSYASPREFELRVARPKHAPAGSRTPFTLKNNLVRDNQTEQYLFDTAGKKCVEGGSCTSRESTPSSLGAMGPGLGRISSGDRILPKTKDIQIFGQRYAPVGSRIRSTLEHDLVRDHQIEFDACVFEARISGTDSGFNCRGPALELRVRVEFRILLASLTFAGKKNRKPNELCTGGESNPVHPLNLCHCRELIEWVHRVQRVLRVDVGAGLAICRLQSGQGAEARLRDDWSFEMIETQLQREVSDLRFVEFCGKKGVAERYSMHRRGVEPRPPLRTKNANIISSGWRSASSMQLVHRRNGPRAWEWVREVCHTQPVLIPCYSLGLLYAVFILETYGACTRNKPLRKFQRR
ncbi:hypothetical protein C8R45DRAFT_942182 [Mycena sanguinolenta]|nr:hypothetical protein C8R45DRAFT_942182 [Mycena sanguinolenta]